MPGHAQSQPGYISQLIYEVLLGMLNAENHLSVCSFCFVADGWHSVKPALSFPFIIYE